MKVRRETESERRIRYAAKDVTEKLGIRAGQRVRIVGKGDAALLDKVRAKTERAFTRDGTLAELVLYWPSAPAEVTPVLKRLKAQIEPDAGIWVVSAKRGHEGDSHSPYLPDAVLIPLGLAAGLVDNKICSVSEHESAMRFVIRRAERKRETG